jgi:ABC-type methionine transport system ATPase subunit
MVSVVMMSSNGAYLTCHDSRVIHSVGALDRYPLKEEEVLSYVTSSLQLVNMQNYMYRATHTLSGGQRQRVAIAGDS